MRKSILFIFAGFAFAFLSCCDKDKPNPNPIPETQSEYTLQFKSSKIEEFKQIGTDKNAHDIAPDKIKEHWGERVANNTPVELHFKKDSLHIVNPNNFILKYKIQWQGDVLYLHNKVADTWRYAGEKTATNQFSLNIGFYSIVSKTEKRVLQVIGQDYALKTYSELGNYPESTTLWLKVRMLFEKNSSK